MKDSYEGLRVLWATDGSAGSEAAVPILQALAPRLCGVRVLTVAPRKLLSAARPEPAILLGISKRGRQQALADARAIAEQAAAALPGLVPPDDAVSAWGNPIKVILDQASKCAADLVVLGAKGQSALGFLVLGSVSSAVVQYASRPVLVVRPGQDALSKVLVAYDGSLPARKLLKFLPRVLPAGAQIVLVTAVEPFVVSPGTPLAYRQMAFREAENINRESRNRALRSLRAAKKSLESAGFEVSFEALLGDPAATLLEAAKGQGADLVAVGSRKPSPARHYLLGSTAERLVRHCEASVLVVR